MMHPADEEDEKETLMRIQSKRAENEAGEAEIVRGIKCSAPSDTEDQVNFLRKVTFVKMQQCQILSDNNFRCFR